MAGCLERAIPRFVVSVSCLLPWLPAEGQVPQSAKEVLLDRCDDVARWGVDPGGEFPGAQGNLAIVTDAAVGKCLRLDYDFTLGGRYVTAARELDVSSATAFSFRVRQEGKNHGFIRVRDATQQEHAGGFSFAGDGWQEVTMPLDLQHFGGHWHGADDGKFHFPLTRIIIGVGLGETKRGKVWLKDLCALTTDVSMHYAISFQTSHPGNVAFTSKGKVPVTVLLDNALDEPSQVVLRLSVDDWHGEKRAQPPETIALSPRGRAQRIVALDARRPEYFRVLAEVLRDGERVAQNWTGLVVTEKPRNFGVDDSASFFGIQHTTDGARTERLGVKWVRSGKDWRWGEMHRGKFDFGDVAGIRRNHQLIMYTMTAYPPQWAEELAGKEPFWEGKGSEERIALWANYVEQTTRALKDEVDTFEIQNEPDLTCMYQMGLNFEAGVERYLKILGAGAAAIRRGAPEARVAGIDVSGGDYDGGLKYSEAVMARAGDSIDVYTGHPYAGVRYFGEGLQPMWPVRNEEQRKCRDTLAMIQRHGGRQRFWVGEKGWGLDVKTDPLSEYSRDFARCLVQSMVIAHSVSGVERYFWFLEEGCNEGGYEYGLFRQGKPLPAALAYATLARMLHHAKAFRSPELGQLIQAHCFVSADSAEPPRTRDGTLVLWCEGDRSTVSVAAAPVDCTAFDLMGREVVRIVHGRALSLSLDRSPLYVRFKADAAGAVCRALAKATITCNEPVKLETAYLADLEHLLVRLKNVTPQPVKCELTAVNTRQGVMVGASQTLVVTLPAPRDLLARPQQEIPVKLGVGETLVSFNARADLSPCPRVQTATRNLQSLESRPGFVLDQRGQVLPPDPGVGWNGPDDLSAKAWVGWDDQSFYFVARVCDDVHCVANAEAMGFWESDSLQIAIDPLNDAAPTSGYDADDVEVGLVLAKDGARAYETVPHSRRLDLPFSAVGEGTKTVYQIAIPWALLKVQPKLGKVLGFNFILNENDGNGRAYSMGLTPGIGEAKRPWVYRDLFLAE